jgi:hypothetical protein
MKKIAAVLLICCGIMLIIISILALVKAFEVFNAIGSDRQNLVYIFGSILFPLLLTVLGRWLFRKGVGILKVKRQGDPGHSGADT